MKFIADLHIHSKYSRGCSRELTLENIEKWCEYKGIDVVSTGDFTYPLWLREIKAKLESAEAGLFRLKGSLSKVRFILGTEISCIYTQGGKCRRIHVCLLVPNIDSAEKIILELSNRGCNLKSDGRPIIGLSAKELAELAWSIDPDCFVFPAHAWTPWFSVFGSKSGFDSLEECFEELSDKIFAIETGLSSDPPMNRLLSSLEYVALISNSDAHSPANLGREANIFDLDSLSYGNLIAAITSNDRKKFISTIEFFPEEGKYHIDGHAGCDFSCYPQISKSNNNLCPKCGKKLILGVLHRIEELADRDHCLSKQSIPHVSIIPLMEIISDYFGVGKNSKKVSQEYIRITEQMPELKVLIDAEECKLKELMDQRLVENIMKMRRKEVDIKPGYDGIFGSIGISRNNMKT